MTKDQLAKLINLVDFHIEDRDELGQQARELLPILEQLAAEPEVSQAVVEQQLAEDVLYFGSSFYRLVDGKKVRIPPNEIYVGLAQNREAKP